MLSFPITMITIFLAILFFIISFILIVDVFNRTPSISVLIVAILNMLVSVLFFIVAIRYGDLGSLNNLK